MKALLKHFSQFVCFWRRYPLVDQYWFFALWLGSALLVGLTAESIGFTRDEGFYFRAGLEYSQWFRELWQGLTSGDVFKAFSTESIDRNWKFNHEHPALMKTLFALSYLWLKENLGIFELSSTAFRFPAWIVAGLSVSVTYALTRTLAPTLPRRAAVLAALLWLAMPHAFWHMHLACFDIPITMAHTAFALVYMRATTSGRSAIMVAIAFTLAAAVKHNVWFAPPVFAIHYALAELPAAWKRRRHIFSVVPRAYWAMLFLSPVLYVVHWPWLWPNVFRRLGEYVGFHLYHENYPIMYFRNLLVKPPFPIEFPFVMSAVTLPAPTLAILCTGTVLAIFVSLRTLPSLWRGEMIDVADFSAKQDENTAENTDGNAGNTSSQVYPLVSSLPSRLIFLVGNGLFPFVIIAHPQTPIFGGTKHWMNGLPFLCALGAWSIEVGIQHAQAYWQTTQTNTVTNTVENTAKTTTQITTRTAWAYALLLPLVVGPGFYLTSRIHPYGLASYNEIIGFARGAANVGMQRTFWGFEPRSVLPEVNQRVPQGGKIMFGDTNELSWRVYRRDNLLRNDISYASSIASAKAATVQPQGEFKSLWLDVFNQWGTQKPAQVLHIEGVPLLTLTFAPPLAPPRTSEPPKTPKP